MRIDWLNLDDVFDFLVIILMENKKDRAMTVGGPPVYGVREVCSWQMGSKDRRSIILPYTTHGQRGLYTGISQSRSTLPLRPARSCGFRN